MLALAVITAVTVGAESPRTAAQRQEAAEYRALLEATPLAQVGGGGPVPGWPVPGGDPPAGQTSTSAG